MKMTKKELLQLQTLLAKAEGDLNAEDKTTLTNLKAKAVTEQIQLEKLQDAIDSSVDAPAVTTDEELKSLITAAVTKAAADAGIDQTEVVSKIEKAIKESGKDTLTAEAVQGIVQKHLGGAQIDQAALVSAIKGAIPSDQLTSQELAKALDGFAKTVRQPSKMVYDDPYTREFPIEHRSGNLSVAEKQLLNVCISNVSKTAKRQMKEQGVSMPEDEDDMDFGITKDQLAHAKSQGELHARRARHMALYGKALTTGGTGSGAELIPTDLSGELMTRLYLESQLAAEFVASEIDMPSNPFMFPMTTTRTTFYKGSENPGSDPANSEPGTDDITLNAKKLIGISDYSYEADEDSIIAVLPMLLENMASGAADALEGAIINGDATASHMDSDTELVALSSARLFRGLRKHCHVGEAYKVLTGGILAANIAAMRKMMGKWGIRPRDLLLIVGPSAYNDIIELAETLTFEKVGNASSARILTGEAASIYGIRIVISSQVREDLNADGIYDGSTTTQGSILLVHRPSWILGVKRGFTVEVDVDKKRQLNSVIASFRRDFVCKEPTGPTVAIPTAVMGYGYTA